MFINKNMFTSIRLHGGAHNRTRARLFDYTCVEIITGTRARLFGYTGDHNRDFTAILHCIFLL